MIDTATRLFCIFGSPVAHSKSPAVHNALFESTGINGVYLAFEPDTIAHAVQSVRTLNIRGASVTIPFKETVMEYLDQIDPAALQMGAVNTIVNENGILKGYNTDCLAAVTPLAVHGIKDKTVCIVGAGGAAKAVAWGVVRKGGRVIVTNRTHEKGEQLARKVNGQFVPFENAAQIRADIVVNATSLGMGKYVDVASFPEQALHSEMIVMDVVYTPLETVLLKAAKRKGCITIDGLSMFAAQAAAQFELWTGKKPSIEQIRQEVLKF